MSEEQANDSGRQKRATDGNYLHRRSYLKKTAAVALVATGGTSMANADSSDPYDVIEVPAGSTHTIQLNSGDTLENVLIDITASGAEYRINASGDDWAIRNVGVRGQFPAKSSSVEPIIVQTNGGSGVIENVYLGDGAGGSGSTGIFVFPDHSGDILIDRLNVQDWPDNGVYASAVGNPHTHPNPGAQGTVRITNSFGADCGNANFRLGSDGSYCENCVSVGGSRGYWGYYWDTELRNCDISSVVVGEDYYSVGGAEATVTLDNCRVGSSSLATSTNDLIGTSQGTPSTTPPESVPTTPKEAASGSSSTPDQSIDEVWNQDGMNHVVFEAASNDSIVEYQVTGTGRVEYGENANTDQDDQYRETITTDSDEFVVNGYLASGGTDDFHLEGSVSTVNVDGVISAIVNDVEFDPTELEAVGSWSGDSSAQTTDDGSSDDETTDDSSGDDGTTDDSSGNDTDTGDSTELPNTIVIDGSEAAEDLSMYTFSVSGEVEKNEELTWIVDDTHPWDSLESVVSDGKVTGIVGNGQDGFRFSGSVTSIQIHGNAAVDFDSGN